MSLRPGPKPSKRLLTPEVDEFHLGGRTWSDTESVGYFLDPGGAYRCRRKNGEILGEWPSLRELLAEELPAAETRERERWTGRSWPWELS